MPDTTTTAPDLPTLQAVEVSLASQDGALHQVTVHGEVTANEHLLIAPSIAGSGYSGNFCLLHVPSGKSVWHAEPWKLKALVALIAHLDWSFTDPADFKDSPTAAATIEAIRGLQLTDSPGEFSPPAHDAWGPDGKGKGLKRRALPMIRDFLADYQRSHARTSGKGREVPLYVPDPDNPDAERGKPNPEWTYEIIRQVNDYGLAYLLAALHRTDPEVADSAAAALADAWEGGDSVGEWAWQWARELAEGKPLTLHGIPGSAADLFAEEPTRV